MTRMRCSICGFRPAVSMATLKCEVCLYAEQFGAEKAATQAAAAERERKARQQAKGKR